MSMAEPTKVLAIDDDPDICFYIQEILERNNCQVTLVERGRDALQLIASGNFDLVMADVRLPDLDGVSILEHVRLSGSEVPFVLITGFAEHEPIISSMRLGAVDYLTKPFTPSDLEKALRRALQQKKRLEWSRHLYRLAEHQDLTLHEKIQKMLLLTADLMGMDLGFVIRSSSDGQILSFCSGQTEEELDATGAAYDQHVLGQLPQILTAKDPLFFDENGKAFWAALPLRIHQQIQGAVCFYKQGPRSTIGQETARSALRLTELSISRLLEAEENAVIIANQQSLLMASQDLSNFGAFTNSIVHAIEHQLHTIAGNAVMGEKLLQTGAADGSARVKAVLASIGTDVKRIDRIVKGVKTIGQAPADAQPPELLQLKTLLAEALEIFRCRCVERPIHLNISEVPERFHILGDSAQLLQVFLRLLNHSFEAIEGMSEQWIRIEVKVKDSSLQLLFTDSGPTLPAQLINGTQDLNTGLSLARSFMENHQGRLWIDPQSSNTRFVVEFLQLLNEKGQAA